MTTPTEYAAKLRIEIASLKEAMVDPGYTEFQQYRDALSRVQALRWALQQMKLAEDEE